MMKRIFISLAFIFIAITVVSAQPFADEIAAFKKADSIDYPFKGMHPIVFAGSSSFRLWKNMQGDFPGYPILNRGFGGATLPDLIRYVNDVIIKYAPKQVVIYCGENDFASSDSITAKMVFSNFKKLYHIIRNELPQTPIVYISMKPSPSREKLQEKVKAANTMIKKFLHHKEDCTYIDIYSLMLNEDGSMKPEIYISDRLHMNEKGYAIWIKAIQPYLLK